MCGLPAKQEVLTANSVNFCSNKYQWVEYRKCQLYKWSYVSPPLEHQLEVVSYDRGMQIRYQRINTCINCHTSQFF